MPKPDLKKKIYMVLAILAALALVFVLKPNEPDRGLLEAFENKVNQFRKQPSSSHFILIDYRKPVFMRRLWVLDQNKEVVLNVHVGHAFKSGLLWAKDFSNEEGSETSCAGLFVTSNSYTSNYGRGEYAVGMRIKGLEKGVNDHALKRNIVFHSNYAPWSQGCFTTLPWINKKIVELTQGGSLTYVHGEGLEDADN